MKTPKSLCRHCEYRRGDYCPIKDDYIESANINSCFEFSPKSSYDTNESYNIGHSVIEFDDKGREYYAEEYYRKEQDL